MTRATICPAWLNIALCLIHSATIIDQNFLYDMKQLNV